MKIQMDMATAVEVFKRIKNREGMVTIEINRGDFSEFKDNFNKVTDERIEQRLEAEGFDIEAAKRTVAKHAALHSAYGSKPDIYKDFAETVALTPEGKQRVEPPALQSAVQGTPVQPKYAYECEAYTKVHNMAERIKFYGKEGWRVVTVTYLNGEVIAVYERPR